MLLPTFTEYKTVLYFVAMVGYVPWSRAFKLGQKTHHGHTPPSHYHRACSNVVGNEKQLPTENPWLNVSSEVKDTFKLIQKSHYFFWIFFLMSVANEVFFYWSSLGCFSRRIRKTTGGQKKIWNVILRYLKVIPLFRIVHHPERITLRLQRWRPFSLVA